MSWERDGGYSALFVKPKYCRSRSDGLYIYIDINGKILYKILYKNIGQFLLLLSGVLTAEYLLGGTPVQMLTQCC